MCRDKIVAEKNIDNNDDYMLLNAVDDFFDDDDDNNDDDDDTDDDDNDEKAATQFQWKVTAEPPILPAPRIPFISMSS